MTVANQTDRLVPKADKHSQFWQNAHFYFDRVFQTMNLDPTWRAVLSTPKRVLTVSCPIKMDDGKHPGLHRLPRPAQRRPRPLQGRHPLRRLRQHGRGDGAGDAPDVEERRWSTCPTAGPRAASSATPRSSRWARRSASPAGYTAELLPIIGPQHDIPAPDAGTDAQVMAWMLDTYSMMVGYQALGVVTGKPVSIGGSVGREEATGRGVMNVLRKFLATQHKQLTDVRVAVQGFGNVGYHTARLLDERGATVVAHQRKGRRRLRRDRHRRRGRRPLLPRERHPRRLPRRRRDHQRRAAHLRLRRPDPRRDGEHDRRRRRPAHPGPHRRRGRQRPHHPAGRRDPPRQRRHRPPRHPRQRRRRHRQLLRMGAGPRELLLGRKARRRTSCRG